MISWRGIDENHQKGSRYAVICASNNLTQLVVATSMIAYSFQIINNLKVEWKKRIQVDIIGIQ